MEIHFPHLTNKIPTTPKQRRLITTRRLLTATIALVLCSVVVILTEVMLVVAVTDVLYGGTQVARWYSVVV